ncbi:MAG: hypothetical protein ACREC8_00410, partial [Limisphaerales bacterium]
MKNEKWKMKNGKRAAQKFPAPSSIFHLRLILALAGFLNFPLAAQTLTTIITNGPASNRVNLVFFSEGYTSAQLGQFLTDVTNATASFFSVQPYTEYSNYFN